MKKLTIEQVKAKLPAFVTIYENTYNGVGKSANFHDIEYSEDFTENVSSVIRAQSGCKSRTRKKRSDNAKRIGIGIKSKIPIEDIIAKLPSHLEIDVSSYKGVKYKARFKDTEENVWFEARPNNVLRTGKGIFGAKRKAEHDKTRARPREEIQKELDSIYGPSVIVLGEDYISAGKVATFFIEGNPIRINPASVISGKYFARKDTLKWRAGVINRDNNTCQKCSSQSNICAHHILTWQSSKEQRFNINNGLTLCEDCHNNYHASVNKEETLENFCAWLDNSELETILKERLAAPVHIPPPEI